MRLWPASLAPLGIGVASLVADIFPWWLTVVEFGLAAVILLGDRLIVLGRRERLPS